MNAQELATSILADARKKISDIQKEESEELKKLHTDTLSIIRQARSKLYAEAKQKEAEEKQRQEAKRQQEAAMLTLRCKQKLIDEAFKFAENHLEKISGDPRKKLLSNLWDSASRQIQIGSVIPTKKDSAFFRKKSRIKETIEGIGGFIAFSKDEKVSLDMRFETILETVKAQKTKEVASILFQ